MDLELEKKLLPFLEAACARKAEDILVLDLQGLVIYADLFLIMSANSSRQARAIAEYIRRKLKDAGIKPLAVDGAKEGSWVLMDYGDILVHIFHKPVRAFYDLEGLWRDAPLFAEELISSCLENAEEVLDSEEEELWDWGDLEEENLEGWDEDEV